MGAAWAAAPIVTISVLGGKGGEYAYDRVFIAYSNAAPGLLPSFLRMIASGQKRVKDA